jgi:hypothetical protein
MHRGASLASVILLAAVSGGLLSAPERRPQAAPTPMQLFQKMLPAVRHPRCVSCHGGVDPITTGRGHPPGKIDTVKANTKTYQPCTDCHDESKEWSLPAADHSFVGRTDEELCYLFAEFAMKQGHARFISNHLKGDELIVAAFNGLAGGARDTTQQGVKPDKPPMDHKAFVKLGEDWVDRGQGACELLGTITLEETVSSVDTFHIAPHVDNSITQDGTRTVTLTLQGGRYLARIETSGTVLNRAVQNLTRPDGMKCTVDQTTKDWYSGTTTGYAQVVIKDTIFFGDTEAPQTDYRIDITLPPETTRHRQNTNIVNGCGILLPQMDSDDQTFDWDSTTFTIEGHVEDPKRDGRAGACDKMVKHGDLNSERVRVDPRFLCFRFAGIGNSWTPGLMDRGAAIAFHDGSDIPFRVIVRWNLKFK